MIYRVLGLLLYVCLCCSAQGAGLACDRILPTEVIASAGKGVRSVKLASCAIAREGLSVSFELDSSLVKARGSVVVEFYDEAARSLGAWISSPFVGHFSGLAYRPTVPVPVSAKRAVIIARTEGVGADSNGRFKVSVKTVARGIALGFGVSDKTVVMAGAGSRWSIKANPDTPSYIARISVHDIDGAEHYNVSVKTQAATDLAIHFPQLPVGYYNVTVVAEAQGFESATLVRSLAVISGTLSRREGRFGIDAALSWYGGSDDDIKQAIEQMQLAGIGAVRDRLTWSTVQPTSGKPVWGRFLNVARLVAAGGVEQVTTFHDSPKWVRPGDLSESGDRRPPTDMEGVRQFGAAFARDMGPYFGAVEFWNEQNSNFFSGAPWQYANALKAFSNGVKSVAPQMKILIGSASGQPGVFFDGIYANGVNAYFDIRNQHYYGSPDEFSSFMDRYVRGREALTSLSDRPGWLTETGFSLRRDSRGGFETAEREQATHLVKAFASGFANGYDRVFYFFLRELVEGDFHTWGILHADFSPRPAYVALANLTRVVAGMRVIATRKIGDSNAVFFRSTSDQHVAIVWGKGSPSSLVGPFSAALDIFGRPLNPSEAVLSDSPIIVTGIAALPAGAKTLAPKGATPGDQAPFRLKILVQADAPELQTDAGNFTALHVSDGATVTLTGRVVAVTPGANQNASLKILCSQSPGVVLMQSVPASISLDSSNEALFRCVYKASLASIGRGYIRARVEGMGASDVAQVDLIADASSVTQSSARSLFSKTNCANWEANASKNLRLRIDSIPEQRVSACDPVRITAELHASGETWVFPVMQMSGTWLSGTGIVVDVNAVAGQPFPPQPLMVQFVQEGGSVWIIPLQRVTLQGGKARYSGLFSLAKLAPWSSVKTGHLELPKVKKILLGWGGYAGQKGQKFTFQIDQFSVTDGGVN